MFRKNTCHRQLPLTSHVDELPEPLRKRLQNRTRGLRPSIGNSSAVWTKNPLPCCMPIRHPVPMCR